MRRRGCDSRRALHFPNTRRAPACAVESPKLNRVGAAPTRRAIGGTCAVAARLPRKKSAMGATPFASTNSRKRGCWDNGVLGGNGRPANPISHFPSPHFPNSSRVMIRRVGCNPAVVKRSGSRRVVHYHHHPPFAGTRKIAIRPAWDRETLGAEPGCPTISTPRSSTTERRTSKARVAGENPAGEAKFSRFVDS